MTPARWVNMLLILEYLLLTGLYACDGSWQKSMYWIGAAVISTSILLM